MVLLKLHFLLANLELHLHDAASAVFVRTFVATWRLVCRESFVDERHEAIQRESASAFVLSFIVLRVGGRVDLKLNNTGCTD